MTNITTAKFPLQSSGDTITHAHQDGTIHVPPSYGQPAGNVLTTQGGSADAAWAAPTGGGISLSSTLTGYTTGTNTPINSSSTILGAFENLQAEISAISGGGGSGGTIYVGTSPVTVATTAATNLMPGISSIPSASQAPGNVFALSWDGIASWATLANTLTVSVALGSTTLLSWVLAGSSIPYNIAASVLKFRADLRVFAQTAVGSSATVKIKGKIELDGGIYQGKPAYILFEVDEVATVNTTAANALQASIQWSAAGGNTLTIDDIVEYQISSTTVASYVNTWNMDGGNPTSVYGGTIPIDCGGP